MGLWETVGMADKEKRPRLLRVPRPGTNEPGECYACGQQFTEPNLLYKFRAHSCNEDASQAAVRIVREATED
jgi:hypothetical protein